MCDAIPCRPRVAVVGVHGISDHAPSETARLVTDALLTFSERDDNSVRYEAAHETYLRIPVKPVRPREPKVVAAALPDEPELPTPGMFEERSAFMLTMHQKARLPKRIHRGMPEVAADAPASAEIAQFPVQLQEIQFAGAEIASQQGGGDLPQDEREGGDDEFSNELSHGFMKEQLESYECVGTDTIYDTVCIKTVRATETSRADVDIYEVHWSDLLRPKLGVWRIFGELYQTLFHLCQIGRQTVDFAFARHATDAPERFLWRAFSAFHRWAVRILTLVVPILNIFLLGLMLLIPVGSLPVSVLAVIVRLVPVAVVVSLAGLLLMRSGTKSTLTWLAAPFVLTALVLAVSELVFRGLWELPHVGLYQALAVEGGLLMLLPIGLSVIYYEYRRPGARAFAGIVLLFYFVSFVSVITQISDSEYGYTSALVHVIEVFFIAIAAAWTGLLILNLCALIPGVLLWLSNLGSAGNPGEASRCRRAINTAFLSLSLPNALFLLVTLVLYSALAKIVGSQVGQAAVYAPSPVFMDVFDVPDAIHPGNLFDRLIDHSSTPTFLLFLYLLVLAILLCVWGLLPVILMDLRSKWDRGARAELTGIWLNHGYHALALAAVFIFIAAPITLAVGILLAWTGWLSGDWIGQAHIRPLWAAVGALVVGSAVGVLAFHGRLQKLALGFRPILNSILDVDNYLREFPRDAAPRARICARYASLLRYICSQRDLQDHPYDAIVIVAHSQGTVISADLLRFLQKEGDSELGLMLEGQDKVIPSYLFTVGCPLRQLYGWRFPHLYGWARHSSMDSVPVWTPDDLMNRVMPDPSMLGVRMWVNAYGSGDYVGRHLWRSDQCPYQWMPPEPRGEDGGEKPDLLKYVSEDPRGARREFCIGAAAHLQYFAKESPVISELDCLIQLASIRKCEIKPCTRAS